MIVFLKKCIQRTDTKIVHKRQILSYLETGEKKAMRSL